MSTSFRSRPPFLLFHGRCFYLSLTGLLLVPLSISPRNFGLFPHYSSLVPRTRGPSRPLSFYVPPGPYTSGDFSNRGGLSTHTFVFGQSQSTLAPSFPLRPPLDLSIFSNRHYDPSSPVKGEDPSPPHRKIHFQPLFRTKDYFHSFQARVHIRFRHTNQSRCRVETRSFSTIPFLRFLYPEQGSKNRGGPPYISRDDIPPRWELFPGRPEPSSDPTRVTPLQDSSLRHRLDPKLFLDFSEIRLHVLFLVSPPRSPRRPLMLFTGTHGIDLVKVFPWTRPVCDSPSHLGVACRRG